MAPERRLQQSVTVLVVLFDKPSDRGKDTQFGAGDRDVGLEQRHNLGQHKGRPGKIIKLAVGFNSLAELIGFRAQASVK